MSLKIENLLVNVLFVALVSGVVIMVHPCNKLNESTSISTIHFCTKHSIFTDKQVIYQVSEFCYT